MQTPANVNELIKLQWRQDKALARLTEKACRTSDPEGRYFSCDTAAVLAGFVTVHPEMLKLKDKVQLLQCEPDPVLITGPTGTGKEIIARALHGSRTGKFVAVNCTALPSELLESEVFGHVKGAFTGALDDRVGKFRAAFAGTLFLDEIGDMPIDMQAKLLRVLQEKRVTPLGTDKEVEINCRVVCATNRGVEELLNKVHFREDLYYRLAVFTLQTLGLRDRIDDIQHLIDHFGGDKMSVDTVWDCKGNVRSLQAQVRRWQVLGE